MASGRRDFFLRLVTAGHPSSPPDLLERRARDRWPAIRQAAARNPACPPPVLARLAVDKVPTVREAALRHRAVPLPVLLAAARGADERARAAAAANGSAGERLLDELAGDPAASVRVAAARHCVEPATCWRLTGDEDAEVRRAAAANPATPVAALEDLARAAEAGDDESDAGLLLVLAWNPVTPIAVVTELASSADPALRAVAARHRHLSPGSAARLSFDPDAEVVDALAACTCDPERCRALAELALDVGAAAGQSRS